MNALTWARSLILLSLFAVGAAIAENINLAAHVRAANDRFEDVAVAVSEGYASIPCASDAFGKDWFDVREGDEWNGLVKASRDRPEEQTRGLYSLRPFSPHYD